jgi:hypothetical protein
MRKRVTRAAVLVLAIACFPPRTGVPVFRIEPAAFRVNERSVDGTESPQLLPVNTALIDMFFVICIISDRQARPKNAPALSDGTHLKPPT